MGKLKRKQVEALYPITIGAQIDVDRRKKISHTPETGRHVMRGGIYTDDVCPIYGEQFKDFWKLMVCVNHPKQRPTRYRVRYWLPKGSVQKRFASYEEADRFLNEIRFKSDEGTFDSRDYQKGNPLFSQVVGPGM
jgi:hypothetical protein